MLRVLVAEDNQVNQQLVVRLLLKRGHSVLLVGNGREAIAAYERTLLTFDSPYDRYRAGDKGALTAEQKQGLDLFSSTRTGCSRFCPG